MTRFVSPALALVLFALPVDAQRSEPADAKSESAPLLEGDAAGLAGPASDGGEALAPEETEVFDEGDVSEFEGGGFCGGEETIVDRAHAELRAGNAEGAKALLVAALRRGEVDAWSRGSALLTLAEAQLSLGEHALAARNYAATLRTSADYLAAPARVGLAAALFLQHRRRAALRASHDAATVACATGYSQVECYVSHLLVASSTRDDAERAIAAEAARAVRVACPDYAESFDAAETRLGVSLPPAPVAS